MKRTVYALSVHMDTGSHSTLGVFATQAAAENWATSRNGNTMSWERHDGHGVWWMTKCSSSNGKSSWYYMIEETNFDDIDTSPWSM